MLTGGLALFAVSFFERFLVGQIEFFFHDQLPHFIASNIVVSPHFYKTLNLNCP
jgi:hypothetical protein